MKSAKVIGIIHTQRDDETADTIAAVLRHAGMEVRMPHTAVGSTMHRWADTVLPTCQRLVVVCSRHLLLDHDARGVIDCMNRREHERGCTT